ncbi:MAG: DUF1579 family protein [Fimbriimonadaceae bacterium]
MRKILLSLLTVAAMGTAFAQVPDLNPPKEIEELAWLKGNWAGSSKFSFGGMELEVSTKMSVSMDGQFLKSVSTNDYGMLQATETMLLGYDAAKNSYFAYAFTNMAPTPRKENGKMEGGSLVMVSDPWDIMGQATVSRGTMTKLSDTKLKFKLEFKAGDGWELASEMEMTKQ